MTLAVINLAVDPVETIERLSKSSRLLVYSRKISNLSNSENTRERHWRSDPESPWKNLVVMIIWYDLHPQNNYLYSFWRIKIGRFSWFIPRTLYMIESLCCADQIFFFSEQFLPCSDLWRILPWNWGICSQFFVSKFCFCETMKYCRYGQELAKWYKV